MIYKIEIELHTFDMIQNTNVR